MWSIFSYTLTTGVLPLLVLTQKLDFHLAITVMLNFNTHVNTLILEPRIMQYLFISLLLPRATCKVKNISMTVSMQKKGSVGHMVLFISVNNMVSSLLRFFACVFQISGWSDHIVEHNFHP